MFLAHVIGGAALVLIVNMLFGRVCKNLVQDDHHRKLVGLVLGAVVGIMLAVASQFDVSYSASIYVPAAVLAFFILNAREKKLAKKGGVS